MGTQNKREVAFRYTSNESEIEADNVPQGAIDLFADLFLAMMNRMMREKDEESLQA